MCKCHKKMLWTVDVTIDQDAMFEGYDGDLEPGTDTSNWVAYNLVSHAKCSRCGEVESHDALGGVWVTDERGAEEYLIDTAKFYGMVPRHVKDWDLLIEW